LLAPVRSEFIQFENCIITGNHITSQIAVGGVSANISFTNCTIQGTFANGPGAAGGIFLPSSGNKINGLWYSLTADARINIGGSISDISPSVTHGVGIFLTLDLLGSEVSNVDIGPLIIGTGGVGIPGVSVTNCHFSTIALDTPSDTIISNCSTTGVFSVTGVVDHLQILGCRLGDALLMTPGDTNQLMISDCLVNGDISIVSTGMIDNSRIDSTQIEDPTFVATLTVTVATVLRRFRLHGVRVNTNGVIIVTMGSSPGFDVSFTDSLLSASGGLIIDGVVSLLNISDISAATIEFRNTGAVGINGVGNISNCTSGIIRFGGSTGQSYNTYSLSNLNRGLPASIQLGFNRGLVEFNDMVISNSNIRSIGNGGGCFVDRLNVDNCTFTLGLRWGSTGSLDNIQVNNCIMPEYQDNMEGPSNHISLTDNIFTARLGGATPTVNFATDAGGNKPGDITNVMIANNQMTRDIFFRNIGFTLDSLTITGNRVGESAGGIDRTIDIGQSGPNCVITNNWILDAASNLVTAIPILPGAGSITGIVADRDLNVAAP
jgi:hypothetical protein